MNTRNSKTTKSSKDNSNKNVSVQDQVLTSVLGDTFNSSPPIILLITLSLVPLSFVRIGYEQYTLSILSWAQIVLILCTAFAVSPLSREVLKRNKIFMTLNLIFVLSFLAKAILTQSMHGWGIFIEWIALPALSAAALVAMIYREKYIDARATQHPNRENSMLVPLCDAGGAIRSGLTVALAGVVLSCIIFVILDIKTFDGRLSAIWPSPNHIALLGAPLFVFLLSYCLVRPYSSRSERFSEFFVGIVLLSYFIVLCLTQSLAGIFAVLIVSVCIGANHLTKKRAFATLGVTGILLLAVTGTIVAHKWQNAYVDGVHSPLSSRTVIWDISRDLLQVNPLVGIPLGSFQEEYLSQQSHHKPYPEWAVPHPHNLYMAMWLNGGFVAFIAFLLLLCGTLMIWYKEFKQHTSQLFTQKTNSQLKIASFCALSVVFMHGLLDTAYFRGDLAFIFWIMIATLYGTRKCKRRSL